MQEFETYEDAALTYPRLVDKVEAPSKAATVLMLARGQAALRSGYHVRKSWSIPYTYVGRA